MSCYHPIKAYVKIGETTKKGKQKIVFKIDKYDPLRYREILLPCGNCIGCRLDYSKEWATRCMLEKKYHENSYFLTITYDEENLVHSQIIDNETGEYQDNSTLVPKHLQDFIKRLRSDQEYKYGEKIRFYACGEYGEKSSRSHYHMLLYGGIIPDLKPYFITKNHDQIYTSEYLTKLWGKGYVTVGEVTWDSARYVARYVMKKHKGLDKTYYEKLKIEPEFIRMSLKPGIGYQYYQEHKENIFYEDEIHLPKKNGQTTIKPARYYEKMYEEEKPEHMYWIKRNRQQNAIKARQVEMSKTTKTMEEMLQSKENVKQAKAKLLVRSFESGEN